MIDAGGERVLYFFIGFVSAIVLSSLFPRLYLRLKNGSKEAELYAPTDSILLNVELKSRWMNMGWWQEDTVSFPAASEALARKVGEAAHVGAGIKLLVSDAVCSLRSKIDQLTSNLRFALVDLGGEWRIDVGYGCGDSIKLWAESYGPSRVVGITSLTSQHSLSLDLINMLEQEVKSRIDIDLQCGDGAQLQHLQKDFFDAVVSIDAAYHFDSRSSFLRGAFETLKPGGHLGITDLILSSSLSSLDRLLLRLIFHLAHVPNINMIEEGSYRARLAEIGFEEIVVEDISEYVYDGLISFIEGRGKSDLRRVFNGEWGGLTLYAKVLRWFGRPQNGGAKRKLSFVLVSAKKPAINAEM